jgi:hypothetical protein
MYSFSASKAFCYSDPYSKVPEPLNTLKKGMLCSAIFAMNRFNATILLVSLCTFFPGLWRFHADYCFYFIWICFNSLDVD